MKNSLFGLCLLSLLGTAAGQGCPSALGWVNNGGMCYQFSSNDPVDYQQAIKHCQSTGATLVSVNSESEHTFIKRWLLSNDNRGDSWWTSGRTEKGQLYWEGDGTDALYTKGWAVPASEYKEGLHHVIYKKQTLVGFGWATAKQKSVMSYICEISMQEVYRISQEYRGFEYGLDIQNPSEAPRGPYFLVEPESTVILRDTTAVFFDCAAGGNPGVEYVWLRQDVDKNMKPVPLNERYSTMSGRLNILNPRETTDQGVFQCKVTNEYGTILSAPVNLAFGSLDSSPTVKSSDVIANEQAGAQLVCPEVTGKPGKVYQWYKDSPMSFIRPEYQTHSFMSASGKLLFSEVAETDAGTYFCVTSLTSYGHSINYVGSSQPQSVLSRGFDLVVQKSSGNTYSVDIQKDFIYLYPKNSMKGTTLRLECFAYGSLPLTYSWGRTNGPFPEDRYKFSSANRVLMLYNVDESDSGSYYCNVSSSKTNTKQSVVRDLVINAVPYFVYPLGNQHVDAGKHLSWHCEAMGTPFPIITWYKDGKVFTSSSGVTVVGNTLSIQSLDLKRDNGMYQCFAKNSFGISVTTAQLRVLSIIPSFKKNPMTKLVAGALGGNATLLCRPVGAPKPIFSWFKDDSPLNLMSGQYKEEDHYQLLLNGNLMINNIEQNDQARYKCSVKNSRGTAEDYTNFSVFKRSRFSQIPKDEQVEVNMTVTLMCQASHPQNIDMIYIWSFNDHVIDFEREPEYKLGQGREKGYLYVNGAQYRNEGTYTCASVSASDRQQESCYLSVLGPPLAPAGVVALSKSPQGEYIKDKTSRYVLWLDPVDRRRDITHHFIQYKSEFDTTWTTHPDGNNLPLSVTSQTTEPQTYKNHQYAKLTNLKSGAGIQFRVLARGVYGIGAPSKPTDIVQIESAAPSRKVTGVRGGGGSVGDLTIWWDPLPRSDHNGPNLWYKVQYKLHTFGQKQNSWTEKLISHADACFTKINIEFGSLSVCQFVSLIGKENYYTQYDARIMAYNNKGDGPFTDPAVIRSAENLPQQTPQSAFGLEYNATSLIIRWVPIPNTRISAGGTLKGYKVNYWRRDFDTETQALQNIIELKKGQTNLNQALIIGLTPVTWYRFNIQAYNNAGNGLKSSDNEQQTWNRVPEKFPTEVYVYSIEGMGVRVKFRGISTQAREEPLQGYKVQLWKSNENIRSAREYDFGKRNSGVIKNLNSSELYQLRVFAYSRAGQGKRSSPTVYFSVGDGQILYNAESTEIMSGVPVPFPSVIFTVLVVVLSVWTQRWT